MAGRRLTKESSLSDAIQAGVGDGAPELKKAARHFNAPKFDAASGNAGNETSKRGARR